MENLPGLPDNITSSAARRARWIALFSPRVPALDLLAPYPLLRKVALRLPRAVQPDPALQSLAVAVDEPPRSPLWPAGPDGASGRAQRADA